MRTKNDEILLKKYNLSVERALFLSKKGIEYEFSNSSYSLT